MKLYNDTPFSVACQNGLLEPGKRFLTIIVKATYDIGDDGKLSPLPAGKHPKPGPSEGYLDDLGNARKIDSDLLPFKPRADCVFIGNAYAPGGEPVETLEVAFGVGEMSKRLSIYGDRAWRREADGSASLIGPEPFIEMPMRDEFAHGGLDSKFNPNGKGFELLGEDEGSEIPVANIMPPDQVALAWDHDVPHQGYGILPPAQQPRRGLAGTYDKRWAVHRRPLPPRDFDVAYFNGAREDQQVDGYLAGDEEISLENLHPSDPEFKIALPGVAARCFVNRALEPEHPDNYEFAEVVSFLDTCIVNMLMKQVTLVWRGSVETISKEHERIRHMLIAVEPISQCQSLEHYAQVLREKRIDKRAVKAAEEKQKREAEAAQIEANGIKETIALLKQEKADPALIAEVEQQKTIYDVELVLTRWLKAFRKTLPNGDI